MRRGLRRWRARTANSCCRAVARASIRIDTLPQPMSSKRATAPKRSVERSAELLDEVFVEADYVKPQFFGREMRGRFLFELLDERLESCVGLLHG